MKTSTSVLLVALAAISATTGAPADSDRQTNLGALSLPSLQQIFQQLQANVPSGTVTQLQQSLLPFLANLLSGQQPAGRTLNDIQQLIQQFLSSPSLDVVQQLQSSLSPEALQQLQSLLPFLANILDGQPAGRTLNDFQQLIQRLQQLQSSLSPAGLQQLLQSLPPFLANLITLPDPVEPTGRADFEGELTKEEEEEEISEFLKVCNNVLGLQQFGGYPSYSYSGYNRPTSTYNSGYGYNRPNTAYSSGYGYGSYPNFNGYNPIYSYNYLPNYSTGFPTGYNTYPYNGYPQQQRVPTGRAVDVIDTKHGKGGKGGKGKHWWNNNYYNYNSYQQPYYNPYFNPYSSYIPYNSFQNPQYQYQNQYPNQYPNYYNVGTIGNNGVVVPAGTTITGTTGTTTAIREETKTE